MKKNNTIKLFTCLVFGFLLFFKPLEATMLYGKIADYGAELVLNTDASIAVTETISHSYEQGENRSLSRVIPLVYNVNGKKVKIKIGGLKVTDVQDNEIDYDLEKSRDEYRLNFINQNNSNEIFKIKYNINNAYLETADSEDLYVAWLGNFEANDIRQTKVTLKLPGVISEGDFDVECLSGREIMNSCVSSRYVYAPENKVSEVVFIDDSLRAGQKINLNIRLPKTVINRASLLDGLKEIVSGYWYVIIFLVFMPVILYLRKKFLHKIKN